MSSRVQRPHDDPRSFNQGPDPKIAGTGCSLIVTAIDQEGFAAGAFARLNVPPTISDHVARGQFDAEIRSGAQYQAGLRFPAAALVAIVMEAGKYRVKLQLDSEQLIDAADQFLRHRSPRYIGLIGHDD
jgi:hypothetical protein